MKITKEEFADRVIKLMTQEIDAFPVCTKVLGLKKDKCCRNCESCIKQAIEQGVE